MALIIAFLSLLLGAQWPFGGSRSAATDMFPRGQWRRIEVQFTPVVNSTTPLSNSGGWIVSDVSAGGTNTFIDAPSAWGGRIKFTTAGLANGEANGTRATNTHQSLEAGLNSAIAGTQFGFEVATDSSIAGMRIMARYLPGGISRTAAEPGNSFGWIYDTANGTSGANWLIQNCTPSCAYVDTGVAVAINTEYQLVLTKTSSSWAWSIRSGGSFTLAGSGTADVTAASVGMGPVINMSTGAATTAVRSFSAIRHWADRKLY